MAPPAKAAKHVFKTASPFTETTWPHISLEDQDIILELVCNLVAPLGDHRRTHVHPSKGKKRKRAAKQDATMADAPPPAPEIAKHVLVGINSVTRHLEARVAKKAPSATPIATSPSHGLGCENGRPLSVVIVTHPKPAQSIAHAHLPTLVHISALRTSSATPPSAPGLSKTRLVSLATSTDARLASMLHIPRVGALAVFEGAPGARALEDFVRDKVGLAECKWVDEALQAEWRGANIKEDVVEAKTMDKGVAKRTEGTKSNEMFSEKA